jgi:hypothetical protein
LLDGVEDLFLPQHLRQLGVLRECAKQQTISKIPLPADATAALAPAGYSRENPVEAVFCRAQVSTPDLERFGVSASIMF